MKKFKTYDEFAALANGGFQPMPADFDVAARLKDDDWRRFAKAELSSRDVRILDDGRIWVRFESKLGMQVVTCWSGGGELTAWSVPLEDCGAIHGARSPCEIRDLDVYAFVVELLGYALALGEMTLAQSIKAFDIFRFEGRPDEFHVPVSGENTFDIAKDLWTTATDESCLDELAANDSEEIRTWKLTLLRLAAALGGETEAQRELAWRLDPGNESTRGFKKDSALAARWYELAAKKGDALAANNFAVFCSGGDIELHNCKKALHYFGIAAKAGLPTAVTGYRRCKECRERVRRK